MNIIKTLPEFTFERMNKCTDELAPQFLKSVRAIYGSKHNGSPIHIGSCVAIEFKSKKYLLTAAHVLDENKNTSLYVSGESNLILIESEAYVTNPVQEERKNDTIDFAIIILSEKLQCEIGNIEYLTEDTMLLEEIKNNDRHCLALGYPNSKNKFNPTRGNHLKETPFVYSSYLKSDEDIYVQTGTSPIHHYLLDFCKKHSKDENNKKVNSIYPQGVSGGGLFQIEGMTNPHSYKLDSPCHGKLIGILIEFKKEQKVLVFTKLSIIINALTIQIERDARCVPAPHLGR